MENIKVDVIIPGVSSGKRIFHVDRTSYKTDISDSPDHCNEYRRNILE